MSSLIRSDWCDILKVPLTFFLFNRTGSIMVDDPALTLGRSSQEHFLNDVGQASGRGFHSTGQRVAAEGTETHHLLGDTGFFFVGEVLEDAIVVDHDQRAILLD